MFGQISIARNITRPATNKLTNVEGVGRMRSPEAKRRIQVKLRISSAVSNTAGITDANEMVESRLNWIEVNKSRPRYSQFPVRRLISSNSHHAGTEITNKSAKCLRDLIQSELPVCIQTKASITRMYPSHSGKNR